MQMLEVKATLLRSNPQAIRQFYVPANFSIKRMHQLLKILFGDVSDEFYEFKVEEEVINPSENKYKEGIAALFREREWCIYSYGENGNRKIRLQSLGIKETEGKEIPVLIRSRGKIMPSFCRAVSAFNQRQLMWTKAADNYYYRYDDVEQEQKKYSVGLEQMNFELHMQFAASNLKLDDDSLFQPDLFSCISLEEILSERTVNQLREQAKRFGIPVLSNVRKAELVQCMVKAYCNSDFVKQVLNKMTLMEYRAFQKACQEDVIYKDRSEEFDTLLDYGLICVREIDRKIICSKELVQMYVLLLEDGLEAEYLPRKIAACVIRSGCWLYGYLTEHMYHKLLASCYLGKLTDRQAADCWEQYSKSKQHDEKYVSKKRYYYNDREVSEEVADRLIETEKMRPLYIPNRQELEQMELDGLTFSKNYEMLENYLVRNLYIRNGRAYAYIKEMYQGLHMGMSSEAVVKWLFDVLHKKYYANLNQAAAIKKLLDAASGEVRRIALGGYTEEKMRQLTIQTPPNRIKIMPNEPCPCGSGRKYKMCCGRNRRR